MRAPAFIFVVAAALAAGPASAVAVSDPAAGLEALRDADQRVAAVAYRLVTANVAVCPGRGSATGLVLHDLAQYRADLRALAGELFALGPGLGVSSVVPESPAAAAGIRANDRIVAVNGRSLVGAEMAGGGGGAPTDGPFAAKLDLLEQELGKGAATLAIVRTGAQLQLVLVPAPACASRFQLVPGTQRNAWSDGEHVSLTTALLDFVANDDELAVVLGHELAHNILEHRARLRSQGVASGLLRSLGRNARKVEATEIEADRFGLRLMDKAGFRPAAAEAFWQRFASASGLMLSTTHPGLKARLAIVRETEEALAREHSGR